MTFLHNRCHRHSEQHRIAAPLLQRQQIPRNTAIAATDERLLIKCDSSIYADNISSVLEANNITVRRHDDESTDRQTGAHGTDSGTALYVPDKDYEKALEIIAPIADRMHEAIPFCPKCGSDNVTPIAPFRYTTAVIIASVILGLGFGYSCSSPSSWPCPPNT